jgi:hypothetical protein
VKVRRAIVKRRVEPPKTRHGRRDVLISGTLAAKLSGALEARADAPDALLFATSNGTPLDPDNVRTRTLKPLVREVGAVGRLPHASAHVRVAPACAWRERRAALPRARPPLTGVHAGGLRTPAARRGSAGVGPGRGTHEKGRLMAPVREGVWDAKLEVQRSCALPGRAWARSSGYRHTRLERCAPGACARRGPRLTSALYARMAFQCGPSSLHTDPSEWGGR